MFFILFFTLHAVWAQNWIQEQSNDYVQDARSIKSIQFYPLGQEQALPVMTLGATQQLHLSFDDLRADNRNITLLIEHCNADWTKSRLTEQEYVSGLNQDFIYGGNSSINTQIPYTHYSLVFPQKGNMQPMLPGNYKLKVYDEDDLKQPLFTRRFYVVNQSIKLEINAIPSTTKRNKGQKLDIRLLLGGIKIANPVRDLKVVIMQNGRPHQTKQLTKPQAIQAGVLVYNNPATFDFDGGNEFRSFDTRSLRLISNKVQSIEVADDGISLINLYTDLDLSAQHYQDAFDQNGRYFIRNDDFDSDSLSAAYTWIRFNLAASPPPDLKDIYVVGQFNQYQPSKDYRMEFAETTGIWSAKILLKQGVYDYSYAVQDAQANLQYDVFEGNHFETENQYDVLVYYRKPGQYWDEIIAYKTYHTDSTDK